MALNLCMYVLYTWYCHISVLYCTYMHCMIFLHCTHATCSYNDIKIKFLQKINFNVSLKRSMVIAVAVKGSDNGEIKKIRNETYVTGPWLSQPILTWNCYGNLVWLSFCYPTQTLSLFLPCCVKLHLFSPIKDTILENLYLNYY